MLCCLLHSIALERYAGTRRPFEGLRANGCVEVLFRGRWFLAWSLNSFQLKPQIFRFRGRWSLA
jgi:hypothetical protein